MTLTPEQIEEEALKLPMGARAILAQNLLSTEAEIFSYFLSPLSLWERGRG